MNYYSPLLRKLPIPAVLVDLDGIVRIASESAKEMGYLESERVGYPWLLEFLSSDDANGEELVEWQGGWWQVQMDRVEDGAVIVATDISKQVSLQQALIHSYEQQSAISLQTLRHDAKTFLNGADYYLMMAEEEALFDSALSDSILKAKGCIQRLRALLESLSYFYGDGASKKRKLVFRELVEHTLETLRPKVKETNAVIEIEGNGERIWGDASRLGQALMNLISNAIHYQPRVEGHIPVVKIGIKVDATDNSYIILEIEDNGIGIDNEHHDRIFDARMRLHNIQDYSGSGWGLAIVKKVVAEHNGSVGVSSGNGYGSKFWIRLPRDSGNPAGRR